MSSKIFTNQLDNAIEVNKTVYKRYELSDDEIAIIEKSVG
ncbi:hypothetical protein fsci_08720 [Francisella sciaenopsi]|uniref:Uncharacterized protein n=1 Tax=Francisella sciaenopsi TaxID=3055034 RepID=A0ABQ6PFS8_9GAMM